VVSLIFLLISCPKPPEKVEAQLSNSTIKPEEVYINGNTRCVFWIQTVRVEHTKYFGIQFPYWYGVGQLETESNCRSSITSFDSGQGIAQMMPKTAKYINSLMGEDLDPYNPKHAIRMQAFYMHRIHNKENWTDKLWIDYQIYNGGGGALKKEYERSGVSDWDLMKSECRRNKIEYNWGTLDPCKVNYDYSKKVEEYGNKYRRGNDRMSYW